jgi:exosome complex RNA-binding protein Csl4
MTINSEHRAAAQAAIQQIAEIQAMHAELTEKINEAFRYVDLMKAKVTEEVIPRIYQAVGDDPVESGQNAKANMHPHAETE